MAEGNKLLELLQSAVKMGVSDLHFRAGLPPGLRTRDGILNADFPAFTDKDMLDLCASIIKDEAIKQKISTLQDLDGSFEVPKLARFRYNIFRNQGRLGAILRVIPNQIPSIDGLGLPPVLKKIAGLSRGLVLVTGATGSGKSSTLAAVINEINESQACHILTIEDPVEFVHQQKKSRITQREVGRDTESFASALRSALRQDPDVILVGEMRDIETLDIALKAAETGHLVFSTVHTTDAVKTIGRLISLYPPEEQQMVRLRLAENLEATISQRLVPKADGKGRVVAMEIMRCNLAIRECIADARKTSNMNGFIDKSHETLGSQTFDMHLAQLVNAGQITRDTALEAASNSSDFQRNLTFGETQLIAKPTDAPTEEEKISLESYGEMMGDAVEQANGAPAPEASTPPPAAAPTQRGPAAIVPLPQAPGSSAPAAATSGTKKIPPVPKIPA